MGNDIGTFSEHVDVQDAVVSGLVSFACAPIGMGAGVVVNQAFNGLASPVAEGFASAVVGGNANMITSCIDWVIQYVRKEDDSQ